MKYFRLSDEVMEPSAARFLPHIINADLLSDTELEAYGIVRCEDIREPLAWWQRRGERVIDLDSNPVRVIFPSENLSLETVKELAWQRIKDLRHEKRSEGVEHEFPDETTGRIQIRDEDMGNLMALHAAATSASMVSASNLFPFTDAENVTRYLSAGETIELCLAAFEHGAAVHVLSQQLRTQVEEALTVAEVVAIEWPEA